MAPPIAIRFQPPHLAEHVAIETLFHALRQAGAGNFRGELLVFQLWPGQPVQLSLTVAGSQEVHTAIQAELLFSPGREEDLERVLVQMLRVARPNDDASDETDSLVETLASRPRG